MGKSQRDKGLAFERVVAKDMTRAEGRLYQRNLEQERGGTQALIDVQGSGRFALQTKCGARPNPLAAFEEAKRGAQPGKIPAAMIHRTSSSRQVDRYVVLGYDDFMALVAEITPCEACPRVG